MYSEVFRKISLEDEEYMDTVVKAPEFGNSASSYETVILIINNNIISNNKLQ